MGVAESRLGRGARVLGLKINEMPSYGLYSTNHSSIHISSGEQFEI